MPQVTDKTVKGYVKTSEDAGFAWFFIKKLTEIALDRFLDENHLYDHYGGPGQPYSRKPVIMQLDAEALVFFSSAPVIVKPHSDKAETKVRFLLAQLDNRGMM